MRFPYKDKNGLFFEYKIVKSRFANEHYGGAIFNAVEVNFVGIRLKPDLFDKGTDFFDAAGAGIYVRFFTILGISFIKGSISYSDPEDGWDQLRRSDADV